MVEPTKQNDDVPETTGTMESTNEPTTTNNDNEMANQQPAAGTIRTRRKSFSYWKINI